jgi:hypothetical protein
MIAKMGGLRLRLQPARAVYNPDTLRNWCQKKIAMMCQIWHNSIGSHEEIAGAVLRECGGAPTGAGMGSPIARRRPSRRRQGHSEGRIRLAYWSATLCTARLWPVGSAQRPRQQPDCTGPCVGGSRPDRAGVACKINGDRPPFITEHPEIFLSTDRCFTVQGKLVDQEQDASSECPVIRHSLVRYRHGRRRSPCVRFQQRRGQARQRFRASVQRPPRPRARCFWPCRI